MPQQIGIDSIALAVPKGYLDLSALAEARGVPVGKYIDGLGVVRMAVAGAQEDPVALGAMAGRQLFARAKIDHARIGMCVVGTESAVDHSKPVAAYLHSLLQLPQQCRIFEAKHACFGGTAGLLAAVDWIASGAARGRTALVICTDIARYALGSAGEPTQGAGAVAMLVSENPRLLALEAGVTGSYANDVNDFWRPLYSKEAIVDGPESVQCYLDALTGAYQAWRRTCAETKVEGPLIRRCYHVPYGKMAKKAHRRVMQLEGKDEAAADASFELEVATSLRLPSQIGNIYTGSLYLALASLFEAEAGVIEGGRVGLFSYGSGSCAEFFAGRVVAGAGAFAAQLELAAPLRNRTCYSFAEYEQIRRADDTVDQRPVEQAIGAGVAFLGIDGERRVYA